MDKIITDTKIEKVIEANQDLTADLIRDILVAKQEARDGKLENYPHTSLDTPANAVTRDDRLDTPADAGTRDERE